MCSRANQDPQLISLSLFSFSFHFFVVFLFVGIKPKNPTSPPSVGLFCFVSFVLSLVLKTQPNYWTKRMVNTLLTTYDPRNCWVRSKTYKYLTGLPTCRHLYKYCPIFVNFGDFCVKLTLSRGRSRVCSWPRGLQSDNSGESVDPIEDSLWQTTPS